MKLVQIFSNPIVQVVSFCIILVGSPEFGGPYGFFLYHAVQEGYAFAITGLVAILLTFAGFIKNMTGFYLQATGAICMILSLMIFIFSSPHFRNISTFHEVLPLLTLLLFIIVISSEGYNLFMRLKLR